MSGWNPGVNRVAGGGAECDRSGPINGEIRINHFRIDLVPTTLCFEITFLGLAQLSFESNGA